MCYSLLRLSEWQNVGEPTFVQEAFQICGLRFRAYGCCIVMFYQGFPRTMVKQVLRRGAFAADTWANVAKLVWYLGTPAKNDVVIAVKRRIPVKVPTYSSPYNKNP